MANWDTETVMADSHSKDARMGVTWLELDQRYAEGITTTLEWCRVTDQVWVRCDLEGMSSPLLCCRVEATDASRAFRYPFAYAYVKLMSLSRRASEAGNGRRLVVEQVDGRQAVSADGRSSWARRLRSCLRAVLGSSLINDDYADVPGAWK
jgi:hypothetical protein